MGCSPPTLTVLNKDQSRGGGGGGTVIPIKDYRGGGTIILIKDYRGGGGGYCNPIKDVKGYCHPYEGLLGGTIILHNIRTIGGYYNPY